MLGKILAPLGKVLLFIRKRLFKRMDSIHQIRLLEPEEDFLLFLPLEECLLQAFLCPTMTRFWQLGSFDRDVPEMRRRALLSFYTHCIKKHLHFHGANRRLLSKNPSFTSWTDSLLNSFPDAKLIVCTRPPSEVVPSQLSSSSTRDEPNRKRKINGYCTKAYDRPAASLLRNHPEAPAESASQNALDGISAQPTGNHTRIAPTIPITTLDRSFRRRN